MNLARARIYQSLLASLLTLLSGELLAAGVAAGTQLQNQAAAVYQVCLDEACVELSEERRVTSNLVETLIQQVPGLSLINDQTVPANAGGSVEFAHVLSNTGNGDDRYQLCLENVDADYSSWAVYPDLNLDGVADAASPWFDSSDPDACWDSLTALLAADESLGFVIQASVVGLPILSAPSLDVRATSDFDSGETESNTDTAELVVGPVISVQKIISENEGRSPSGSYRISLVYNNTGAENATNIVIEDVLPVSSVAGTAAGMTYVAGSGRWSVTSSTVMTDAEGDSQGAGPSIEWCAYDTAALLDLDCQDRVKVRISELAPGAQASVSFDITVDAGIDAGDSLRNTANYSYQNATGLISYGFLSPYDSNTVSFLIVDTAENPAVVANRRSNNSTVGVNDSSNNNNIVRVGPLPQGSRVHFNNYIWNTGDGTDTFDIIVDPVNNRVGNPMGNPFPASTVFSLHGPDGETPLVDSNGNGIPDTGPIPIVSAGSCPPQFVSDGSACGYQVVLRASLAPDETGGSYDVTKIARSSADPTVSNAVTDRLRGIDVAGVDITNDEAITGSALGEGAGPEASPVSTLSLGAGETASFVLFINNTAALADNFDLSYSDTIFTPGSLPEGWTLRFSLDGGSGDCSQPSEDSISNTGDIAGGEALLVCAVVTAPPLTAGGQTPVDIYFRAESPNTGAIDTKYDQITGKPALGLEPNQFGQTIPGAGVTYAHRVGNTGNVDLVNLMLSAGPDEGSDSGWAVVLYADTDDDGVLSSSDTQLQAGAVVDSNGDAVLSVGESILFFAQVYAPEDAALGDVNLKIVTAQAEALGQALTVSVEDQTTVTEGAVSIEKAQALDANCDGVADGPGSCTGDACFTLNDFQVTPGEHCVLYRLRAENRGDAPVFNVRIDDASPEFTQFINVPTCTVSSGSCVISGGVAGTTGEVAADVDGLAPGETAELQFNLEIE